MNVAEAFESTSTFSIGVEVKSVRRRDPKGRLWYLVSARGKLFLVRQETHGFREVDHEYANQWSDWSPQSSEEAAREVTLLDTADGRRFRNILLGLILGPMPENQTAPDFLPEDFC